MTIGCFVGENVNYSYYYKILEKCWRVSVCVCVCVCVCGDLWDEDNFIHEQLNEV